jgi:uncharacterized membrane protein
MSCSSISGEYQRLWRYLVLPAAAWFRILHGVSLSQVHRPQDARLATERSVVKRLARRCRGNLERKHLLSAAAGYEIVVER